jgi:hypothetical protein
MVMARLKFLPLLALALSGQVFAQATAFDNLVRSPHVHCAFYKSYEIDRATGDLLLVEGRSHSLAHFQVSGPGRARQISTRVAGARDVKVINTGRYLHYLDHVAGMYVQTTIYTCLESDERNGVCIRYGAMQSRHFDTRVTSDPDTVFEALRDNSDPGFCDHSFINIQEAQKR